MAARIPFSRERPKWIILLLVVVLIIATLYVTSQYREELYHFQTNYLKYKTNNNEYRIGIISDMDKASREGQAMSWMSIFKTGLLTRNEDGTYSVSWKEERTFHSGINEAGRGMELSELAFFNERLYSVDDRTGVVFALTENGAVPHHILVDGDGSSPKGFKGEWMTIKDGLLYVGGMGKEWVSNGSVAGTAPMWIKTIDSEGRVNHIDWSEQYQALRKATGTSFPGYMIHEAVHWHPIERKWYFFPRRVSREPYDEVLDEERCGNIAIVVNEDFTNIEVKPKIGPLNTRQGFSSAKALPGRENEFVLLKTQEAGEIATFIMVYDMENEKVLLPETRIGSVKFEGIEIL